MRERVRRALALDGLLLPQEPVWVAVSGGVDSMVLLSLLHSLGHPCHVIHVDHGLRGAESDADRDFVVQWCTERGLPVKVLRVDVQAEQQAHGGSIQMAARALRYAAFHKALADGPNKLALAHHADDAIETFFVNLMRGMGLRGWSTIPVRSGPFVRPLRFQSREAIERYAREFGILYREDASNADHHYLRNRIRHQLLPALEALRPGTRKVLYRDTLFLGELQLAAEAHAEAMLKDLRPDPDGSLRVPFALILDGHIPRLILRRLLGQKGFHPDALEGILQAMHEEHTGARFISGDHVALIDRDHLVITQHQEPAVVLHIPSPLNIPEHAALSISACSVHDVDLSQGPSVAWLDADSVHFPLELRPWKPGDRMQPLGMTGSKLVSDILTDAKVPGDRKQRMLVLTSQGRILWLCGMRIAEGVQVRPDSQGVLRISWDSGSGPWTTK